MGDAYDMIVAGLDPCMTSSFEEREDRYLTDESYIFNNFQDALIELEELANPKAILRRYGENKYKIHFP
ncbi:hypothetical protein AB7188_08005 [Providencia rettgeri]|nr:hypothetical protein [Providencia rettgeri]